MHGIDADFPVELFAGARVKDIRPLTGIFYFDFVRDPTVPHPTWPSEFELGIERTWHLRSASSEHIGSAAGSEGDAVEAAAGLKGKTVRELTILSPRAILLKFDSGEEVEVLDDSDEYESFCIPELYIYI